VAGDLTGNHMRNGAPHTTPPQAITMVPANICYNYPIMVAVVYVTIIL
jgi:hypothetical protein